MCVSDIRLLWTIIHKYTYVHKQLVTTTTTTTHAEVKLY